MNNFQRKNKRGSNRATINPWIIIGLTAFIALWFLVLAYNSYNDNQSQQAQISKAQKKNISLRNELTKIKPKQNAITSGKFDVREHYKELDKTYLTLLKFAFGTARNSKQLSKYDDLYKQYFGDNGYTRLKKLAFSGSKSVITKNLGSNVAFNNFDANRLTTNVVAYVTVDTTTGKELIYMNCTYDFKNKISDSADFQLNSLDD